MTRWLYLTFYKYQVFLYIGLFIKQYFPDISLNNFKQNAHNFPGEKTRKEKAPV